MQRRPLIVGVLAALVGAALVLFWAQRGADLVSGGAAHDATTSTGAPGAGEGTATPGETTATGDAGSSLESPASADSTSTESPGTPGGDQTDPARLPATLETDSSLRIPGIGLAVDLHPEGLRAGRINPPAGTVMWFTGHDRVAPGDLGTAVVAAHVVAYGNPDKFSDLSQVQVGDEVELTDADGSESTFTVVRAEVVDKEELRMDADVWGENDSVARLALVTCDDELGFRSDGHRAANYVVIAERA